MGIETLWSSLVALIEVLLAWRLFAGPSWRINAANSSVSLEVVIPAHNEARSLGRLLASINSQTGIHPKITVIDDRSSDGTSEVAYLYGANVLRVENRQGNNPKAGALSTWIPQADTQVVVFLDADVVLVDSFALVSLVHLSCARPKDLISVQPYHRTVRWYEQFAFYPNLVALLASGAFAPGSIGLSHATFGPVLCCQVARYREVGGHAVVSNAVLDDQALGIRFRSYGGHTVLLSGYNRIEFRMYPDGFAQLFEGFRKNVATGAFAVRGVAAIGATLVIIAQVGSIATLVMARGPMLVPSALVVALICVVNVAIARRIGSFRWSALILQLLYLCMFVTIVLFSLIDLLRGRTRWKGQVMRTRLQ